MKAVFPHCRKICCVETNAHFVGILEEKKKMLPDMEVYVTLKFLRKILCQLHSIPVICVCRNDQHNVCLMMYNLCSV